MKQDKTIATDISKTDKSNMPDKKLKVIIIKRYWT